MVMCYSLMFKLLRQSYRSRTVITITATTKMAIEINAYPGQYVMAIIAK